MNLNCISVLQVVKLTISFEENTELAPENLSFFLFLITATKSF